MLRKLVVLLLLSSTPVLARWGLSDLDPTNRNSGIRRSLRKYDPSRVIQGSYEGVLKQVGMTVARNERMKSKANAEGWTMEKCRTAGVGIASVVAGFQATAICAAYVAGEPMSTTACVALVTASGVTVTEIACTQLCNDHHLRDC